MLLFVTGYLAVHERLCDIISLYFFDFYNHFFSIWGRLLFEINTDIILRLGGKIIKDDIL